jgi:hypothetical protein
MLMVAVTTTAATSKEKGGQVFHAVVAQDGTGDYLTVQAAIDAAPVGRTEPWRIYIKEGTYKEHVDIPESKPYLSLIGEGRHKTQISCDRLCGGPTGVKVDEGATVTARSSNLFFEGINFVNSYGHEQKDGPQALALFTQGDRVVLSRCGLLSFQDTWLTPFRLPNLRNYAVNCFIEGAVDFIYGQGNVFFDSDTLFIMRKKGGYIVAPNHHPDTEWGYVFRDNVITAPGDAIETQVFLGRPWHAQPKVAFINTKAEVTVYPEGWRNHMGGLPTLFAEYGTTDWQGHRLDLSHRCSRYWVENEQKDTIWCTSKAVITADEAALYTVENVLSGTDGWQPRQVMTSCPQPVVGTAGKYLIWQPVADAVGYVVTVNGQTKRFTTDCRTPYNKKNTYRVQSVSRWGALSR